MTGDAPVCGLRGAVLQVPFTISNAAALVELLAAGGVLAYVAERRRWQPPLWVALVVGLALRLQLMWQTHDIRPYDIYYDYHAAGLAVLHHQDPILHIRPSGWSFLPLYGFVLAGEVALQQTLHLSWIWAVRSFSLLADLAVIVMVGVVAGRRNAALRRFQYACYPLALLYAAGRMDVTCLALALGAFALVLRQRSVVSTRRAVGAGVLLGLAVGVNSWPILLLPGLWIALPSIRTRLQATAGVAGVVGALFVTMPLTVGTPVNYLYHDARTILTYHGSIGQFGWSAIVADFYRLHWFNAVSFTIGRVGSVFTLVAVVAAVWWWRRAHPLDMAIVTLCALIVATASFGAQYLLWPVPFLLARPTKRAWYYHTGVCAWTIISVAEWGLPTSLKYTANVMLLGASVLVVPAIIAAMPWDRRVFARPGPQPGVPPPRPEARAPLAGTAPDRTARPGTPQPGTGQPDGQSGPSLPETTRSGNGAPGNAPTGNGAPETTPTGNAPTGNGAPGNAPSENAPSGNGAPGTTPVTSSAETRGRWRWWPGRASDW